MTDWSAAASNAAVSADGSESEDDPEIVLSPTAASQSSLPAPQTSSASSSPPSSPSAAHSPLSSPTGAAAPPSARRTQSSGSGSGNGYISAQQKRANMDLTGLGSNPRSPPAVVEGPGGRTLQQSSSSSFLSSFAKKLTLNTAAAAGSTAAANTAGSPTAAKPSPQAAAASKGSGAASAVSPPTGRLSGSSSASLSLSASPPASSPPTTAAAVPSTGSVSFVAAPVSPSGSSSLAASNSFGSSGGGSSSGKFSLTSSFGSMLRSVASGSGSGGSGGVSSTASGALSQSEQQKEQRKREWLSLLPPASATGLAAASPPSQSFANPKVKTRCVKLAWFGIPSSVRGDAWQWIIGNSLNITEDLFWIMSGRAQEVKENKMRRLEREEQEREAMLQQRAEGSNGGSSGSNGTDSSPSDGQASKANLSREESVSLIDTDVSRTFPELKFFHGGGPLQAPLYQVLESYGCYRPDVGYVQGMSHIASMLLLNMEPLPAFIAICNLLNQEMYFKFFRMNAQQMKLHLDVFQQVFKDQLPQLYNHFASLGIEPDMYLYDWLLTIFTRALPLDVTHRVWDNFLCVGHVFLFRTSLGLLRLQQSTFLQASFEQALALLNRPPRDIDGEQLFECIGRITVTAERLSKMLQDAEG